MQKENLDTFNADFREKNSVTVTLTTETNTITANFTKMGDAFTALKDEFLSYDVINNYIGSKNSFFN